MEKLDDEFPEFEYHILVFTDTRPCKQCGEHTSWFVLEFNAHVCETCVKVLSAVQFLKGELQSLKDRAEVIRQMDRHLLN